MLICTTTRNGPRPPDRWDNWTNATPPHPNQVMCGQSTPQLYCSPGLYIWNRSFWSLHHETHKFYHWCQNYWQNYWPLWGQGAFTNFTITWILAKGRLKTESKHSYQCIFQGTSKMSLEDRMKQVIHQGTGTINEKIIIVWCSYP